MYNIKHFINKVCGFFGYGPLADERDRDQKLSGEIYLLCCIHFYKGILEEPEPVRDENGGAPDFNQAVDEYFPQKIYLGKNKAFKTNDSRELAEAFKRYHQFGVIAKKIFEQGGFSLDNKYCIYLQSLIEKHETKKAARLVLLFSRLIARESAEQEGRELGPELRAILFIEAMDKELGW